jgi:hypothetical protein
MPGRADADEVPTGAEVFGLGRIDPRRPYAVAAFSMRAATAAGWET